MSAGAGKQALDQQAFINAALSVISDVGVEKISMRRVAAVLSVSPMAVYKHFSSKEELLTAALDEFISRSDVFPDASLPWEQWMEHVVRAMYAALASEISWVPVLGSLRLGENVTVVIDAFIEKLTGAGFTPEQSLQAFFSVIQLVIGAVCMKSSLQGALTPEGDAQVSPLTRAYLENPSTRRLEIAPLFNTVVQAAPLDHSLPLLIEGLRSRLT